MTGPGWVGLVCEDREWYLISSDVGIFGVGLVVDKLLWIGANRWDSWR